MKIFITVTGERSEGYSIDKVYLLREKAEARIRELIKKWETMCNETYHEEYEIDIFLILEREVLE